MWIDEALPSVWSREGPVTWKLYRAIIGSLDKQGSDNGKDARAQVRGNREEDTSQVGYEEQGRGM